MASVKVLLYTHKTLNDGSYPIVLSVIKDRKRKIISLGYSAKESQWNAEKNLPNAKHPHATKLRNTIRSKKLAIERAILDHDNSGEPYTIDDIVKSIQDEKKPSSFNEYTLYLIDQLKKQGKDGNARAYNDAKRSFVAFNNDKDIDFKNITPNVLKKFQDSLLEKGRKVNAISVYLRTIRAIYNKAIFEGIVSEKYYPFKEFKIRNEKTQKRALTKEAINSLKKLDLSDKPHLEFARDIFLFSFYNRGMNFIDIFYLQEKDILSRRIYYRRKKTGQTFSIAVTEPAQVIIDQYCKHEGPETFIFPILTPGREYQTYRTGIRNLNKYLKKVGAMVDINIPLSSYVARHSWATIAKREGISTAIISEGLGHDTEKTTQIYLDAFEDEELDKANEIIIGS